MRAESLLRLFPRAWRERYGEELVALAGDAPLRPRQVLDLVACAVDAWLSPEVRRATRAARSPDEPDGPGGELMWARCKASCAAGAPPMSTREALLGAASMLVGTALFAALGIALRRGGSEAAGEAVLSIAFPAALILSLPFTYTKGHSRRVQILFVVLPLALLAAIAWSATLL